ncbi:MAG: HRDC domain-containing protein [Arenicella sp.]|nr:HRDC domain-containing protein [Arenicella sp.]
MSIQFKLFTLSAFEVTQDESSLNLFLRQHRVLKVHREFVQDQQNAYWSLLVEYLDSAQGLSEGDRKSTSKSRVDYKEVLSPENFAVFAKLRDWRKQQAEEVGVPVYAIFTNQQLAEMVTLRVTSKTQLREVEGVGEARVKKHGDAVKGTVAIRYFNLSFCIAIHQRLLASFLIRDLI